MEEIIAAFKEWIPTVIGVITSLGTILAFISKTKDLGQINTLKEENAKLKSKINELKENQQTILDTVKKIERNQRGIKNVGKNEEIKK